MTEALLLIGCVIALCTLMGRFLDRLAVPSLLIFIALECALEKTGCCAFILMTTMPSI